MFSKLIIIKHLLIIKLLKPSAQVLKLPPPSSTCIYDYNDQLNNSHYNYYT